MHQPACALLGLFALGATSMGQAAAPSPEGLWLTQVHHGVLRIARCGDALCARVVSSDNLKVDPDERDVHNQDPALRSRPTRGLVVIWGLVGGPLEWRNGSAYNPQDGRTYKGSLRLVDANTLKLTGCVFYPLCMTQTLRRIE